MSIPFPCRYRKFQIFFIVLLLLPIVGGSSVAQSKPDWQRLPDTIESDWTDWFRPVENPVFTTHHGNNHDAIIFVNKKREYPYKLIVSHEPSHAYLWRTKNFSWSSASWELASEEYHIGRHYEYDDGVRVDGTYYIYEAQSVYTYTGSLEEADGNWNNSGSFPEEVDDVGVYYEDGTFHLFGEYGDFPHGPDGTSLAHYRSETGVGDWERVDKQAVDPNPDGGHTYGTGDPTITKIEDAYYIYCDIEQQGTPYRIMGWKSSDINEPFKFIGILMKPRFQQTAHWDNYRVQDPDIAFVPDLSRYVIVCNLKDNDGTPGGNYPRFGASSHLSGTETRVMGMFYSRKTLDASDDE